MTDAKAAAVTTDLLDNPFTALVLSILYPTVFIVSHNWYAFAPRTVVHLLLFLFAGALLVCALIYLPLRAAGASRERANAASGAPLARALRAVVPALLCGFFLFFLLYGTIRTVVRAEWLAGAAFVLCVALLAALFARKLQRYYAGLLVFLILLSLGEWGYSYASLRLYPAAPLPHLSEKAAFDGLRFAETPDIYLLVYDAYGSRRALKSLFDVENDDLYRFLEDQGFETTDSFANYGTTWPTMLATFLANHHYLSLVSGNFDTKYGRSIMAGLAYNPVLHALKNNGYRVQFIHRQRYFTTEDGVLDHVYPDEPAWSGLRMFGNPLLNRLVGAERVSGSLVSVERQTAVFLDRLSHVHDGTSGPWFTFSYFHLPGHFPVTTDWRTGAGYEPTFRTKVQEANAHIELLVRRILERDRRAVIVVMGDHGSWRYRNAWEPYEDPNESFAFNGLSGETVALDRFGIIAAVYSAGRCDDEIYPTITPVNVMRAVLACLSGDRGLLEARPPDTSLFASRLGPLDFSTSARPLWLAAEDGKALERWRGVRPQARPRGPGPRSSGPSGGSNR